MPAEASPYKYVRPLKEADLAEIEKDLRPADRLELEADGGSALEKLEKAYRDKSLANYAMLSPKTGKPFGIFGINEESGIVWMVSTGEIKSHAKTFLAESRKWILRFQKNHAVLWNWVCSENGLHVRWLAKWLGFEITGAAEAYGHTYYKVERKSPP